MAPLLTAFSFFPILLVLHCIFIFLFNSWLGPVGTFYSSVLTFLLTLLLALNELYSILLHGNYYYIDFGSWFFCLDLLDSHLVFCIDSLALTSAALVLTLTTFALYFGVEYMYREAFINRLLYLLNLFATSVIFLFFCFDYFLIMFSWECIGLFSLLLVNFYSTRIYTINAALNTFVFSRISDMFMFLSFILTLTIFNTTDLSVLFLQTPFLTFHYLHFGSFSLHFLTLFSFALVTSGAIKAAQFFAHVWLPDAMEAPTPASALIHSSTLVIAGVFLIISFSILFEFTLFTNYYLILLGALTLSFGSVTAVFQNDINKLVAYSTISQIGYLICGCGFCCYEEVLLYLVIHALNNAFLFVLVGYTVHFFNANTDMRQMGAAYLYAFDLAILLFGVCFNLAGLPYSAGFIGNEFLLFQVLRDDFLSLFVRGCWLVSFFFTPIYMFILVFVVSFGPNKSTSTVYFDLWNVKFYQSLATLLNYKLSTINPNAFLGPSNVVHHLNSIYFYSFQFTLVTSRTTIYLLFGFWLFFFFFGEFLLLIVLNYSSLNDLVPSSFFLTFNSHIIFFLNNATNFLNDTIFFYILFFTTAAVIFLLNLKYTISNRYFQLGYLLDVAFTLILLNLFAPNLLICALLLYLFIQNSTTNA